MKRFLPFCLAALFVWGGGCASQNSNGYRPTAIDPTQLNYGPYPGNYQQTIREHFAQTIYEPHAAQYRFGEPFKGYIEGTRLMKGEILGAGYFVEVWAKVKDPAGGYFPERHLVVMLKNGGVWMELGAEDMGRIVPVESAPGEPGESL